MKKIHLVRRQISRYLPYNKISNMIYMVNYNLVLNILNRLIYHESLPFLARVRIYLHRTSIYDGIVIYLSSSLDHSL